MIYNMISNAVRENEQRKMYNPMPGASIQTDEANRKLITYINVKLALLGASAQLNQSDGDFADMASALVARYREEERLLASYLSPADQRLQNFLYDYLQDVPVAKLPNKTFVLDRPGLARALSLPINSDDLSLAIVHSYRVKQGVLHNPQSDRRTTQGIFHVVEGGLPIPDDKLAVPKAVFGKMLGFALSPPGELMVLPLTANLPQPVECFVSLLLRPVVCPEVPGFISEKTMEIRFFAPGSLVSNLDFVESIFGNAGDPFLPDYDAALDVDHWTGHTGCVILAPHLVKVTKQSLGLPRWEGATERQRRDGMAWRKEDEPYNGGRAFKLTCRDENGVIVTLIADNYFGYCKKEVKTQISYSANLYGMCEEEHAGGALVFPSFDLGEDFTGNVHVRHMGHSFAEMISLYGDHMDIRPEGYAVDRRFPDIIYVPENAHFDLHLQRISWSSGGSEQKIKLLPGRTYVRPSGYQVHLEKPTANRSWRLIGTVAEGTFCHKPCTVSGGGKSEISKSISDAILHGPVFVSDFKRDFEQVDELLKHDYSGRFNDKTRKDHRLVLSPERSLGSVIKLLSPDKGDFTPEYNAWLESIPQYVKEMVFAVKRFHKPEWGERWLDHFSVDTINGTPGNELKFDNRKLIANFLRVGYEQDGAWRTFGLRKDFQPAVKLQQEDDISASVVVPAEALPFPKSGQGPLAFKFVKNCEFRLFQRPDEAIHPGYDRQTESDFALPGSFFSNYEALTPTDARNLVEDSIRFAKYTPPIQELIREVAETGKPEFFVASSHPRKVDGAPSKNPRYLQMRPDLKNPRQFYLAEMAQRLRRRLRPDQPLYTPVQAVLPGRRNNPPEAQIRSLAVFNPMHFFELPELFMEFICSMTGKSPSTTGAGSEGALTKGPFNALPPIIDLNNALVAWLLTGHDGFVTAAGYVGPRFRVDHDISLLVPEVWCRMSVEERSPRFLIENKFLEKCQDFQHAGRTVLMHRLGYRINARFVAAFFGRVFNHPYSVFTEEMLRPELQDLEVFVDGVDNIVTTQRRVAKMYFDDGSIEQACPPLQALLHIMAHDDFDGKKLDSPEIRDLFCPKHLLSSPWYQQRLEERRSVEQKLWTRHVRYLDRFLKRKTHVDEAQRMGIGDRMTQAIRSLEEIESESGLKRLRGTIGTQPIAPFLHPAR